MKSKGIFRFVFLILTSIFLLQVSSSSCSRGVASFTLSGTITDATFSQGHAGAVLTLSKVMITTGEEILMETFDVKISIDKDPIHFFVVSGTLSVTIKIVLS
jgi:basic membrane lipoprotein Med (substrate-binding protein (PBP1-ABC) superfamily)